MEEFIERMRGGGPFCVVGSGGEGVEEMRECRSLVPPVMGFLRAVSYGSAIGPAEEELEDLRLALCQ